MIGGSVLIVDDNDGNVYALSSYLEANGMKIHTASGGIEAMEVLNRVREIKIILMDIMMPDMDGFEAIRKIKDHPEYGHIPVIAVTAKAMAGDREKCLEAGADNYLAKPIDVKELRKKIVHLLDKKTNE